MERLRRLAAAFALSLLVICSCKGDPDSTPWCSASEPELALGEAGDAAAADAGPEASAPPPLTWFRDVKPIIDAKCARCHAPGSIGPFSLERWDDVYRRADAVRAAVTSRHMPPWYAARCCTDYYEDASLTVDELRTMVRWIDAGMPIGDAREAPPARAKVGGVSRVDVTLEMPEAYTPAPKPGKTDELRCFLLDWPLDHDAFITGLEPIPGERSVVHHLIVGSLHGDSLDSARRLDRSDGRPGFDCNRLENMGFRDLTILGGSLVGGDFPDGLGRRIEPHASVLVQIHYSVANAPARPDRTKIRFKVDAEAREFKGLAVANLAWLVGDGMKIEAGEKDAVFWYKYSPTLFTKGKTVALRSVTPHMHAFGTKVVVRIVRAGGRRECLLEIPRWHFGWEQPFWFSQPKRLDPDDQIYVECHFDNSREHQPNGQAPRDIAWGGENQDMCAAFLNFTEGAP